jgi:hypothetical protein
MVFTVDITGSVQIFLILAPLNLFKYELLVLTSIYFSTKTGWEYFVILKFMSDLRFFLNVPCLLLGL